MNTDFQTINTAFARVFQSGQLSLGVVVPIENYSASPVPTMQDHVARVQLAEKLGFAAVWLRDVPFNVPSFGDAGQVFDPFVYLGYLAASTSRIGLGMASAVLPLRHPAHVAKAAASADVLSNGRVLLGIASGDRPDEYPAMNLDYATRGARFRDSVAYLQQSWQPHPRIASPFGQTDGAMDLLPKPIAGRLPLLVTGSSQQSDDWIAQNADAWMTYPRNPAAQCAVINHMRAKVQDLGRPALPIMQPLYIDLVGNDHQTPTPIHLGLRIGAAQLVDHLLTLREVGVNHVALNLRFNQANVEDTLKRLADEVLPQLSASADLPNTHYHTGTL
ncbi:N5,N10-methylene tetrahydromethanopterin reductase [Arenicella chitinivorans]|uniref:N5,N10-methylene tetrahydromethanopterin reductase n=1 Tax=Arenicella chitinivorans TaxID=1329800 RepID=A0A918RK50_9GAMM|nr:LLM class oxidoreductase [Arenicella chitinivorans]GHA01150.1 N5,N10-methylene tetrahydromethanopterin reductase [Arenicella chitinivorans]